MLLYGGWFETLSSAVWRLRHPKLFLQWMEARPFVTNIFAFAPNGSIIACTLNAPGTWHDSTLAHWGSMYSRLQKCWEEHHGKVLMDSAFASNMYEFIIQSSQNIPVTEGRQAMLLGQQATSCRQAPEWGMRGLQGSFPRLKDRIIYEENGE